MALSRVFWNAWTAKIVPLSDTTDDFRDRRRKSEVSDQQGPIPATIKSRGSPGGPAHTQSDGIGCGGRGACRLGAPSVQQGVDSKSREALFKAALQRSNNPMLMQVHSGATSVVSN